jgi:hypothetical protein
VTLAHLHVDLGPCCQWRGEGAVGPMRDEELSVAHAMSWTLYRSMKRALCVTRHVMDAVHGAADDQT